MTAIRLAGLLIAAIGYVSGAILVAQPFVSTISASGLVLAFLFPSCIGIGLLLYAVGEQRFRELRISGILLLHLSSINRACNCSFSSAAKGS